MKAKVWTVEAPSIGMRSQVLARDRNAARYRGLTAFRSTGMRFLKYPDVVARVSDDQSFHEYSEASLEQE